MATTPLKDVVATVMSGGLPELSGSGVSNSNGEVSIPLKLSEPQYNQLMSLTARGTKLGYEDGVGRIDTLPSYETANANGLSMQIAMQKYDASELSLSPSALTFPATGGRKSMTVTAPDDNWQIETTPAALTGLMVEKTSNTTFDVICPAGSTEALGFVAVRWGSQMRSAWIVRTAADSTVGTVTFTGKVTNASTGAALASASVRIITVNSSTGASMQVASAITDGSGNYSTTWSVDSTTWSNLSQITAIAEKTGFQVNSKDILTFPSFADAVASGVVLPNLALTQSAGSFTVTPSSINGPREGFTQIVNISGTDGNWGHSYVLSGGNDFANVSVQKTSSTTLTVTFGYNPGAAVEAANYRVAYISVTWNGETKIAEIIQQTR